MKRVRSRYSKYVKRIVSDAQKAGKLPTKWKRKKKFLPFILIQRKFPKKYKILFIDIFRITFQRKTQIKNSLIYFYFWLKSASEIIPEDCIMSTELCRSFFQALLIAKTHKKIILTKKMLVRNSFIVGEKKIFTFRK